MREGGRRDAHLLDMAGFRGWYGVNILLKVLVFIHIEVALLCVSELVFPGLLNIIFPFAYKALELV